ncbi:hypothetical protein AB6F08_04670 [Staphylococcus saprophyticus]|uniref:hypothetical protein n=1 Tax=Staphylococcus saprophyticus TaxID=29385 RepID=UPI0034DD0D52
MDNYSMNDYSLNDITLVDKKYYSELKRKAKAFDEILELHSQHIDTSNIYGSDLPLSANRYEYYDDGLFAYEMYTLIKNYLEDE